MSVHAAAAAAAAKGLDRHLREYPEFLLNFEVEGAPVPWARHKGSGKRGHTAPRQAGYRELVIVRARLAMAGRPIYTGALEIRACFFMPMPPKWTAIEQTEGEAGRRLPTDRPDLDNLLKGVKDALNGVVYVDDSQVVSSHAHKRYSREPAAMVSLFSHER